MPDVIINGRPVGAGHPCYVIAELSANHNQDFQQAVLLIEEAKRCGADAVKLQTYTPDTMTLDVSNEYFDIKDGPWAGQTLYQLYKKAYTPWDWQPELKKRAGDLGLAFFSTPFDTTSADFLESIAVPAYKIASFELTDVVLLRHVAAKGKPVILSTGMGTLEEIEEAVSVIRQAGNEQIILLKCTSDYPAKPERMNLSAIPELQRRFGVPAGLSDHSLLNDVALAAVALGACVIEKHFTLDRSAPGPDAHFSLEPEEFCSMVAAIRRIEPALGSPVEAFATQDEPNKKYRRSLWAAADIRPGETLTPGNVRCVRPNNGLAPRHLPEVLGRRAKTFIAKGTPLSWGLIGD